MRRDTRERGGQGNSGEEGGYAREQGEKDGNEDNQAGQSATHGDSERRDRENGGKAGGEFDTDRTNGEGNRQNGSQEGVQDTKEPRGRGSQQVITNPNEGGQQIQLADMQNRNKSVGGGEPTGQNNSGSQSRRRNRSTNLGGRTGDDDAEGLETVNNVNGDAGNVNMADLGPNDEAGQDNVRRNPKNVGQHSMTSQETFGNGPGNQRGTKWNRYKTEGEMGPEDMRRKNGGDKDENFDQKRGYEIFRNNIDKLNQRENQPGQGGDQISFTINQSVMNKGKPMQGFFWEKRKKDLQAEFPGLSEDEILKLLKREFGLRLLKNMFQNKINRQRAFVVNKLTRSLGRNKRDKITLMLLTNILRDIQSRNMRALFAKFRPKVKVVQTKVVHVSKRVERQIETKIKETQPDKYLALLLNEINKDSLRKAFQLVRLTNLFKKLRGKPGGRFTIEHIQQVKRDVSQGARLDLKLMLVLLDKIVEYNKRKHKRQTMDNLKEIDLAATKALYGKVSKIKDGRVLSNKHHPMFR